MRIRFGIVLIFVISVYGCNSGGKEVSNNQTNANANTSPTARVTIPPPLVPETRADASFEPCNPYLPLVPGSVMKYVIHYSSGLIADMTVVVDAADEGGRKVFTQRSQIVDRSGGMEIVQSTTSKFACDGERVLILSETNESNIAGNQSTSEFQFRENSLRMADPQTLARKGSTWTHAFRSTFRSPQQPEAKPDEPTIVEFQVGDSEQVSTPVGTFKARIITRKIKENVTYDYYAPGVGLVKRQAKEGTYWELREFSGLKAAE
ncbi:MAG TPA: hypothetical protein VLM38_13750 [Blastocatellia bacterium]|nr:hypothetical protein [Blastocatellia bacterium]